MISLKDYAKNKGVSYEAVRKQVSRYREELEGHIQKVNRTLMMKLWRSLMPNGRRILS